MSWVCANEVAGVGQPMSLLGLGERRRTPDPDPTRPILPGPVPGRADFVLVHHIVVARHWMWMLQIQFRYSCNPILIRHQIDGQSPFIFTVVGGTRENVRIVFCFVSYLVVVNNRKHCRRVARAGARFLFWALLFSCQRERRVQNLVISLGAMQGMFFFSFLLIQSPKNISSCPKNTFDDPEVLTYVCIGYVLTQLTVLAMYYYVSMTIFFPVSSSFPNELVFSDQEKERPKCAQIRLALFLST